MVENAELSLPACTLSWSMLYERCGCDNTCVVFIALVSPLLMLILWAFYRVLAFAMGPCRDAGSYEELVEVEAGDARELCARAAIQQLPSMVWGSQRGCECSLCIEAFELGQVVRELRCGHRYHLKCIDRWLIDAQSGSTHRRCPLCGRDPLESDVRLTATSGTGRGRHRSEGAARIVVGSQARRHSSPHVSALAWNRADERGRSQGTSVRPVLIEPTHAAPAPDAAGVACAVADECRVID